MAASPAISDTENDEFQDAQESPAAVSPAQSIRHGKPQATRVPQTANVKLSDVEMTEEDLRRDLVDVRHTLNFFLNSRINKAEEICWPKATRSMYHSLGYAMVQVIKSLMTFQHEDMAAAIECCKSTMHIANLLRKSLGATETVSRWLRGSSGHQTMASMSLVERHAELVYSECLLLKAITGIIYSGDFFAFLREALNLRSAYATYKSLGRYMESARKQGIEIDNDFESGVCLGTGCISLILSLLPAKALNIMSLFGYAGDKEAGLDILMTPGRWAEMPNGLGQEKEGLRRAFNDMILLAYHLVISAIIPVGNVDVDLASRILDHNLKIYPDGAFWLWFAGRLRAVRTQGEDAIEMYRKSIDSEKEYVQLHHICYWDMALTQLALGDLDGAFVSFDQLQTSSNWSKALYSYSAGATLYQKEAATSDKPDLSKVTALLKDVPDSMQKIAGKSIPVEKFAARKSKKYLLQNNRLMLPALELAMILSALGQSPVFKLRDVHLTAIDKELSILNTVPESEKNIWGSGGYWDDYCLLHTLKGICLRLMAFPEKAAVIRAEGPVKSQQELATDAFQSFDEAFENGTKITLDHHIIWFAHFEAGQLCDQLGKTEQAKMHFNKILTKKGLELNTSRLKGKVSLENTIVLRASACMDLIAQRDTSQSKSKAGSIKSINSVKSTHSTNMTTPASPQDQALTLDIQHVAKHLPLVFAQRFDDVERICKNDKTSSSIYWGLLSAASASSKALFSFDPVAFEAAVSACNDALKVCDKSIPQSYFGFQATAKEDDRLQAHAKLIRAEILLLRGVIVTLQDADVTTILTQIVHLRSAYNVIFNLKRAIEANTFQDDELTSGVSFAFGVLSLMLSLLPSQAASILSILGYQGDQATALHLLQASSKDTGIHSAFSKSVLFAVKFSLAPLLNLRFPEPASSAIDVLLKEESEHSDNLFVALWDGKRQALAREPDAAVAQYKKAMTSGQKLQQSSNFLCEWELGIAELASGQFKDAAETFDAAQHGKSSWSPMILGYLAATSLQASFGSSPNIDQQAQLEIKYRSVIETPPRASKKVMKLELFIQDKVRRFLNGEILAVPWLEFMMLLKVFKMAPADVIIGNFLPIVDAMCLDDRKVDECALGNLLRGILLHELATTGDRDSHLRAAEENFKKVFVLGPSIQVDHYFVWMAHLEYGRLLETLKRGDEAKAHYRKITDGKNMELSKAGRSKRVAMQEAIKTQAGYQIQRMNII